jgi:hypothetical protein
VHTIKNKLYSSFLLLYASRGFSAEASTCTSKIKSLKYHRRISVRPRARYSRRRRYIVRAEVSPADADDRQREKKKRGGGRDTLAFLSRLCTPGLSSRNGHSSPKNVSHKLIGRRFSCRYTDHTDSQRNGGKKCKKIKRYLKARRAGSNPCSRHNCQPDVSSPPRRMNRQYCT